MREEKLFETKRAVVPKTSGGRGVGVDRRGERVGS